jgi:hypothetical protein
MSKQLLLIACMAMALCAQAAGADETEKYSDKTVERLSTKFFHYSATDGKSSLRLIREPKPDWYEEALNATCDNTLVKLRSPRDVSSIRGSSRILAFLECPAGRGFKYDSVVAFFDRDNLNVPLCHSRLHLMGDMSDRDWSYYYGGIQSVGVREAEDKALYVVATLQGGDGGDGWGSLVFLRIGTDCRLTVLSKLYSHFADLCNEGYCGGDKMEYRFLDNKTVEVTTTEFTFTDESVEKVLKTSRKRYDLEELTRNPQTRVFPSKMEKAVALLDGVTEINTCDKDGTSPLMWVAKEGRPKLFKAFLDKGAELDAKDNDGWTPLMWATAKGRAGMAKELLEKGADVDAKDADGRTCLMWAAARSHVEVVNILLKKSADVQAKDKDGWTPLMWATNAGHSKVVRILLGKGADVNAKDHAGKTALKIAQEHGYKKIVELLKARGAKE